MSFNRFNLVAFLLFIALFVGVILLPTPFTRNIQRTVLSIFGFGTKTVHNLTSDKSNYNGIDLSQENLLKDPQKLAEDYAALYKEASELRVWQEQATKLQTANAQLRRALDFKERYKSNLEIVAARIIERHSATWWETVLIDRGEKHGVLLEDPVVADNGALVGKVIQLSGDTARVLLLTDEACQVSARVQGTLEKGILVGSRITVSGQTPQLRLKFLSKGAEVPIGASVYSTGVYRKDIEMELGVFPPGLILGKVRTFRKRDTYGEAVVEPAIDFATLTDVFVIQPPRLESGEPDAPSATIPPPPAPMPEPDAADAPPGGAPSASAVPPEGAPSASAVPEEGTPSASAVPQGGAPSAPAVPPVVDVSNAPSARPVKKAEPVEPSPTPSGTE